MKKPPVSLAKTHAGVWHKAVATYPEAAETVCGRRVEAALFSWPDIPAQERRPVKCAECFPEKKR